MKFQNKYINKNYPEHVLDRPNKMVQDKRGSQNRRKKRTKIETERGKNKCGKAKFIP